MNHLVAFIIGIFWEFVLALQVRLISDGSNIGSLFITTIFASLFWAYMITGLTLKPSIIPFYAVGTGVGVVAAVYLTKRKRTSKRK
jgi:hypothetical protein